MMKSSAWVSSWPSGLFKPYGHESHNNVIALIWKYFNQISKYNYIYGGGWVITSSFATVQIYFWHYDVKPTSNVRTVKHMWSSITINNVAIVVKIIHDYLCIISFPKLQERMKLIFKHSSIRKNISCCSAVWDGGLEGEQLLWIWKLVKHVEHQSPYCPHPRYQSQF